MKRLAAALLACAFLLGAAAADAASVPKHRSYTCLIGGTFGCLDKEPIVAANPDNNLVTGDIADVQVGGVRYLYQFDKDGTAAESSPTVIRPDDYGTNGPGVWNLAGTALVAVADTTDATAYCALFEAATGNLGAKTDAGCTYAADTGTLTVTALNAGSLTTTATATPTATFADSDAPGADEEVAKIVGAYVDGADGAENGTLVLYAHVAGTSTALITVDGKNSRVDIAKPLNVNGAITGDVKVLSLSTSCTIGSDCDGTSVLVARGGVILATAAITITLPEIVASPSATQVGIGASLCVIARDAAEALVVDPNAADSISLCNTGACTKDTAGDSITATQAGAKVCLVAVELDNWMDMGVRGTWTAN